MLLLVVLMGGVPPTPNSTPQMRRRGGKSAQAGGRGGGGRPLLAAIGMVAIDPAALPVVDGAQEVDARRRPKVDLRYQVHALDVAVLGCRVPASASASRHAAAVLCLAGSDPHAHAHTIVPPPPPPPPHTNGWVRGACLVHVVGARDTHSRRCATVPAVGVARMHTHTHTYTHTAGCTVRLAHVAGHPQPALQVAGARQYPLLG